MEAAFIFPVLAIMLVGLIDVGTGVLVSQKIANAGQSVGSMLTRTATTDAAQIAEAMAAAQLIIQPYSAKQELDIHVISVVFSDDEGNPTPSVDWQYRSSTWSISNPLNRISSIAEPNEGVIIVGVHMKHEPLMFGSIVGTLNLEIISFARGRQSAQVSCADCQPPDPE